MTKNPKRKAIAVLLLAGNGTRLQKKLKEKKQFYLLQGKELFRYSLDTLITSGLFSEIVLVCAGDDMERTEEIVRSSYRKNSMTFSYVSGGKDRNESVLNALLSLRYRKGNPLVFLHDAARPFVSASLLKALARKAETCDAVTPILSMHDSLLRKKGKAISYLDRRDLYRVQTPQVFDYRKLLSLYENDGYLPTDTDDFSKAVREGLKVGFVRGETMNFKITDSFDMPIAQALSRNTK
jgi:2-C-methyl-D-erythritol 4-phosphate cytidylyltransferase